MSFNGRTLVFGTNDGGSIPSTPARFASVVESVYTGDSKSPGLVTLRVRVSPLVPNTTGEQMRNVVMLAAALMMGCGDEEGDSASDTAAAEDTAAE